MDVSIIIVNYNTKELTRKCLKSVFENTEDINFEVIVSDNGSTDGSIEMIKSEYPQVLLIENNSNLGFGAANNQGLKIAKGKYIFFLNSDTILLNNAVNLFFSYWENSPNKEQIGALGCWLLDENKNIIHSYGDFPSKKGINKYFYRSVFSALVSQYLPFLKHLKKNKNTISTTYKNMEIDGYITGADLFVKNNGNAYFDERFFMYFEESDLQFNNFYRNGLKRIILYEPQIIHLEGGSDKFKRSDSYLKRKSTKFYWESCLKYFEKNGEKGTYWLRWKLKVLEFLG